MNGYLYLIESKRINKRYLGSTTNPTVRIIDHNKGKNKSTTNGTPWMCLMVILVGDIATAKKIEYYIKSQKEKLTVINIIRILNNYFNNLER